MNIKVDIKSYEDAIKQLKIPKGYAMVTNGHGVELVKISGLKFSNRIIGTEPNKIIKDSL